MPARPSRAVRHALLAAALAAGLALAGCSSSTSGGSVPMRTGEFQENQKTQAATQGVYDFTPNSPRQAEGALTFGLPKSLMDQLPDVKPLATKVEVKAHPLKSMEYCAVDVKITFAEGIPSDVIAKSFYRDTSLPAIQQTSNWWGLFYNKKLSEFNEADPKPWNYISDDYTSMTRVARCASGAADSDSSAVIGLTIPALSKGGTDHGAFASTELTAMKSGTLFVRKGEISSYRLDANGTWIKK